MGAGNCVDAVVYRHRHGNASPKAGLVHVFHRGDAPLPFVNGWQLIMQRDPHSAPVQQTTLTGRQLMAVFWPFLRPYRLRIAGAVLSLFLVAGALLTMGRGLAYLVDQGLGKQDPALLDRAVLGTAVIALLLAIGSFLRTTLVNQIGEMVLAGAPCLRICSNCQRVGSKQPGQEMFWRVSQLIRRLFRPC